MDKKFCKTLSANDVGTTGSHQAGILIPKKEKELLDFMPRLDAKIKNPDDWIKCIDQSGKVFEFRYIYYNNKLHDEEGTRNEYRVTHMTKFFRENGAKAGDTFEISRKEGERHYTINIIKQTAISAQDPDLPLRIKLTGWRRVH